MQLTQMGSKILNTSDGVFSGIVLKASEHHIAYRTYTTGAVAGNISGDNIVCITGEKEDIVILLGHKPLDNQAILQKCC